MNDTPLVSVVTPTYQSAHTLPRAFGSLLHQSYQNWEWVVINDGSTDQTPGFLSTLRDPRVRVVTLEQNRGRGFVRNLALREARGEYVCALDADDWFYASKLENQVSALLTDPSLAAVTVGMAVTDQLGNLIGVEGRVSTRLERTVEGPRALKFPFGPTMIRTSIARETGFRIGLRRGADLDFFLRLLCGKGRRLCHLPLLSYVYQGHTEVTVAELLSGHRWSREVYRRHLLRFPQDCFLLTLSSLLKSMVYKGSSMLGFSDWLSRRRFAPCSPAEIEQYQKELALLQSRRGTELVGRNAHKQ